jgi:hypothetical protein
MSVLHYHTSNKEEKERDRRLIYCLLSTYIFLYGAGEKKHSLLMKRDYKTNGHK